MKKILITGSTGFIGSTLIKFFLYKNYEVFALTRKKNKSSLIKYIKADIFDHKRINKVFKKIKPNYLIHLAWEASPNKYQNSKANYKWLHSSLNLYLNFCKYGGSKALITGSCAEYDFNNYLLKEKLIKNPEKKHSFMMLGFKYFLHKWVNNEIIVEGIIPWKEFRKNSINALNQIKSETKKGEQIAVFSSGGTISSMIGEVLGIENEIVVADLNFSVRNTSFSKLLYSNKETNLLTFNELPHLGNDMITFV